MLVKNKHINLKISRAKRELNMAEKQNMTQITSDEAQCLSELLDDQCSQSTIDNVLSDQEKTEAWFRYNTVRSVLNKELSVHNSFGFTQKISSLIDKEPAIIAAPSHDNQLDIDSTQNNVIPFWKKAGGGLAIAASVAYAMVFSVQMMSKNPENESVINQAQFNHSVSQEQKLISQDFQSDTNFINPEHIAEQAQLDAIQNMLNQGRSGLNISEQQVGAELTYSTVIKMDKLKELENQVNSMKKPSEVSEKEH